MNHEPAERIATLSIRAALAVALFFMATAALAQTEAAKRSETDAKTVVQAQDSQAAEFDESDPPPLLMGDATLNLLAWQRSGEIASHTPRPIAGSVASRSYERYIKSFDHPIPEHLGSTMTRSNAAGGGASPGSR